MAQLQVSNTFTVTVETFSGHSPAPRLIDRPRHEEESVACRQGSQGPTSLMRQNHRSIILRIKVVSLSVGLQDQKN